MQLSDVKEHHDKLETLANSHEYKPLTEIVADIHATSQNNLTELGNLTHPILSETKMQSIENFLASNGIDSVAFIGLGSDRKRSARRTNNRT